MATMPDPNATSSTSEYLAADTYSLTDAQLADSMEFIEEIGMILVLQRSGTSFRC